MPPILTAEDVVRRITAECAYVDQRGGVGIRPEPAATIVRRYGGQTRRAPRREDRSTCRRPLLSRKSLPLAANGSSRICRQLPFAGLRANSRCRPFSVTQLRIRNGSSCAGFRIPAG